jgi:hypothetical protein
MSSLAKITEDLIKFYVKQNYDKYLSENNLKEIDQTKIDQIITSIFDEKSKHMRTFLLESIPKMYGERDTKPTVSVMNQLLDEILEDEILCKHKLKVEILNYQKKM